ncbi:unnamed protein product [Alternaria alternata]
MPSFAITPTIRQAVELRLEELEHTKQSFEQRYVLDAKQSGEPSVVRRIERLLEEIENLDPKFDKEDGNWTSETTKRCIEQARDDGIITENKLLKLEKGLLDKLIRFRNRMEVSCLHSRLMKEALDTETTTTATKLGDMALEDDFEVIDDDRKDALKYFESSCSRQMNVHSSSIDEYLWGLFTGEEDYVHAIRYGMQAYGSDLSNGNIEVDQKTLIWIITDLIRSERISQERKETLINYLQSPDALLEVTAILNMRGYREWNYKNAEVGLPVDTRKTIHGQHYVHVEVEIIDMLFLHCCAFRWATKLNECLRDYVDKSKAFQVAPLTRADADRRSFFFDNTSLMPPPPFGYTGFPCPPPPPPEPKKGCRRRKTKPRTMRLAPSIVPAPHVIQVPPPPPPDTLTDVESVRRDDYQKHFFMSRLPKHDGDVPKMTSSKDIQARLIKTLAVECNIRKAFDDKVNALTVKFDSLASTLPHCAIITVLRFLGVPEVFLSLFNRALKPKLSIESSTHEAATTITPERGLSFGYSMEIFFSEAVLFFLDLAIRKATRSYMYRVHDHCYFVGTQVQTNHAEEAIVRFSQVMGMKFRSFSSGDELSVGFLTINLRTTSPHDTSIIVGIDDSEVALYAANAKLRLKSCSTVLEWVREWNDTVGTYAAHLFGPLANVFNEEHREMIKETYRRIHSIVLDGSDLTRCVAKVLKPSVSCKLEHGLPDLEPIIYLPQAYGGLGVKNPFVTIAFASNANESAAVKIRDYLNIEAAYYTKASERYSNQMPFLNQQKIVTVFDNDLSRMIEALGSEIKTDVSIHSLPFMAKAEMMKHRERAKFPCDFTNWSEPVKTPDLVQLYRDLLDEPVNDIEDIEMVEQEINRLSLTEDLKPWDELSQEDRWVLQLYNEECFERYGSLDIWWAKGIPVVVYSDLRGHLLDDDDDRDHRKNT